MEWRTIIGNKHEVSEDGRVRNLKTKRELKADLSGGYKRVLIIVDGVRTHQAIHKLVALAFNHNPNPKTHTVVNHIDENKMNNNHTNLEWTTPQKNSIHGSVVERRKRSAENTRNRKREDLMLDGETWTEVDGGYKVSDFGRVLGKRGQILSPEKHTSGYLRISLGGNSNRYYLHRLVADTYVNNINPEEFTVVNHKNGDKTDNRAVNLEWVSPSVNLQHYHNVLKLR